jgi:Lipoprotein LpqB beta-propeller domain/Sporulation and spore germination
MPSCGTGVRIAALASAVAMAAAGCAAVPTGGSVRQISVAQAQGQHYPQLIPVPPVPDWDPSQIVDGFLAASASFADDHAVARAYLTPSAQRNWKPGIGVTVVRSYTPKKIPVLPRVNPGSSSPEARVKVTGPQVATLTDSGQYLLSSVPRTYIFTLVKIGGQWRIQTGPSSRLLLTETDFEQVYQSRNLYFFAAWHQLAEPARGQVLVPDPVFVPTDVTNTDLATQLVQALQSDPLGWQNGAAATAFGRGFKLLGPVRINGSNATVDLGGTAATATGTQLAEIAAQLVWTLTAPVTQPSDLQSVEIEVNGRPLRLNGSPYQVQSMYPLVPGTSAVGPYFIGSNGTVQELSRQGTGVSQVPGQAGGIGVPALSSVAVSPDSDRVAGISATRNIVYTGLLRPNATLEPRRIDGHPLSVSWDSLGDLWVATGADRVWMLLPGFDEPEPVDVGYGYNVTAFQVAPDGVRAVMIVRSGAGSQLVMAAISHVGNVASLGLKVAIGAGIQPEAVTWYGPDDVIVLARTRYGPQLDEVPLNGSQPTQIRVDPGTVSITADGTALAAGLRDGTIAVEASPDATWTRAAAGRSPAYPG